MSNKRIMNIGPASTLQKTITMMDVINQKWETTLAMALERSKKAKDPILAAFVGLTWCGPCQMLEAEVFKGLTFLQWSFNRVVLLQLDYKLPIASNSSEKQELMDKYSVSAFPTIIGIDSNGTPLGGVIGYGSGTGPNQWIQDFKEATGIS